MLETASPSVLNQYVNMAFKTVLSNFHKSTVLVIESLERLSGCVNRHSHASSTTRAAEIIN